METKNNTIGFGIELPPKGDVTPDVNCPFYGNLRVRGTIMRGTVVSAASHLSATVKIDRQVYVSKYRRYLLKTSKIRVHNPAVLTAKPGDVVEFMQCRPISKTKANVIVRIVTRAVELKK